MNHLYRTVIIHCLNAKANLPKVSLTKQGKKLQLPKDICLYHLKMYFFILQSTLAGQQKHFKHKNLVVCM